MFAYNRNTEYIGFYRINRKSYHIFTGLKKLKIKSFIVYLILITYNLIIYLKGVGLMILEVRDIHKSFSNTKVLHGVSFSVRNGTALGFLGRNGAGKTTTLRILTGLFNANQGTILLNGKPFNPKEYTIGYLPEERGLYPKQKVLNQLIYFGELKGFSKKSTEKSALYWLDKFDLLEYKDEKLETLSKGNQQKVQIAQTLLCDPDIIILDEPFSGLDPVNSQVLKDAINELIEKNKLVIFSSHQMAYVEEFCEELVLIDKGHIVLTGNLKSIKKEMGKNRLTLSALNHTTDQLYDLIGQNIKDIRVEKSDSEFVIIELLHGKEKNNLLKDIISLGIDIGKYSIYEPSLTDIFIKKVGDDNEKSINSI